MNEETGLCIKESDVTRAEMGFEWALDEDVVGEDVEDDMEKALGLNFIVESKELPEEVKLDLWEHLESLWVNEKDDVVPLTTTII